MATSAFKSTSRRGASEPKTTHQRCIRSHSVSAVSRRTHVPSDDTNSISSEFSVRRDNPLFWTASSSSPEEEEVTRRSGEVKQPSYSSNRSNSRSGSSSVSEQRGRTVARSGGVKNGIGRSLSRARGRSVSRPHDKVFYESGNELDTATSANYRGRYKNEHHGNEMSRTNSVSNKVEKRGAKNSGITTIQHQRIELFEDDSAFSYQISNLEDGISTSSLSEAEEKTIKAVREDLNAFQRNNININAAANVPDMTPGFVNTAAVESVPGNRREYSIKLLESEERTRKLRADLAIEEHRAKELGRILNEIIPDADICRVHKSRRERRASNERKKISKCLNEEARAYFDECVSLSTFDSSDFSAPEDLPHSSVGITIPVGPLSVIKGSPSALLCYDHVNEPQQKQVLPLHGYKDVGMTLNSTSSKPEISSTKPYQFSFADTESKSDDIRSYIKHFERETDEFSLAGMRSYYDADENRLHDRFDNVFIDRVLYSSRIESGSLLLCGGGVASFLPFA